jgi:hypothetical protein
MDKSSHRGGIAKRGCLRCLAVLIALCFLGITALALLGWKLLVEAGAVENKDGETVIVAFHFDPAELKPTLRCWVNGIPGDFIIDSGMQASLALQRRFAELCKVPITGKGKVLAHQSIEEHQLGEVEHLAVGASDQFLQLEQTRNNTEIADLDYLPDFEGLLGAEILGRHRAKIDFGAGQITFRLKNQGSFLKQAASDLVKPSFCDREGQITVPLTVNSKGFMTVELSIRDTIGHFLVDTGSDISVISPEFRASTSLPAGPVLEGLVNNTPTSSEWVEISAMSFGCAEQITGTVSMKVASLDALNDLVRGANGKTIDGILGASFLNQYEAIIDYESQTMTLSTSQRGNLKEVWAGLKWVTFKYIGMILHERLGYKRQRAHEADGLSLQVVSIEPSIPAVLKPGEKVRIKIRYTCPNVAKALIEVAGTFQGNTVPVRLFPPLTPISAGSGEVECEISLKESGQLDELRIFLHKIVNQMKKGDALSYTTEQIFKISYPVRLEWREAED